MILPFPGWNMMTIDEPRKRDHPCSGAGKVLMEFLLHLFGEIDGEIKLSGNHFWQGLEWYAEPREYSMITRHSVVRYPTYQFDRG